MLLFWNLISQNQLFERFLILQAFTKFSKLLSNNSGLFIFIIVQYACSFRKRTSATTQQQPIPAVADQAGNSRGQACRSSQDLHLLQKACVWLKIKHDKNERFGSRMVKNLCKCNHQDL